VSPGRPCRWVHQDSPISVEFTLISDGFSEIKVFSARNKCYFYTKRILELLQWLRRALMCWGWENLLAFPGVQRSAEDVFTSVRFFFFFLVLNLQYVHDVSSICGVFCQKRRFCFADRQILIQSDQYFPNSICVCSKSADRKLLYHLWNLTCYLRSFITKISPTPAKCCRIHPTWNMSQLTPHSHFRLSFRYGQRYRRQLSSSTPRQKTILPSLVAWH
jgi:hypothetical protein